jgi:hypothetical protein
MAWQFLGTNSLVWQPDTRVTAFPSGLVLVQRSAVCRNTGLSAARTSTAVGANLPCTSPSTAQVKIFPAAQEIHESNGFVRFDVSGYGYYGSGFQKKESFIFIDPTGAQFVVPRIFKSFVVDSSTDVDPFSYTPTETITIKNRTGGSVTISGSNWALESSDVSGYFGSYKEMAISFAPNFTVA